MHYLSQFIFISAFMIWTCSSEISWPERRHLNPFGGAQMTLAREGQMQFQSRALVCEENKVKTNRIGG
jgi:hypothetical protein